MTTKSDILSDRLTSVATRLVKYKAAEDAILDGAQSYSIGSRTLTRADLRNITTMITRLEAEQLKLLNGGAIRVQRVVPRNR